MCLCVGVVLATDQQFRINITDLSRKDLKVQFLLLLPHLTATLPNHIVNIKFLVTTLPKPRNDDDDDFNVREECGNGKQPP